MHARDVAVRLSLDDGTQMQGRGFGAVKAVRDRKSVV